LTPPRRNSAAIPLDPATGTQFKVTSTTSPPYKVGYTYSEPLVGEIDHLNRPLPSKDDVAGYHTHGATDPRYKSEQLSVKDMTTSVKNGFPEYVGTPKGKIFKFDPKGIVGSRITDRTLRRDIDGCQ